MTLAHNILSPMWLQPDPRSDPIHVSLFVNEVQDFPQRFTNNMYPISLKGEMV